MLKLNFPFVKIELPDDFPSGFDPEAVSEYLEKHPDVANKIVQEYEQAYHTWHNEMGRKDGSPTHTSHQTATRN
jgi:hypothetical protein